MPALPDALAGLDILAKSPTGSGKTLVFAITIVERTAAATPSRARSCSYPTREFAAQVTDDIAPLAAAKALRVACVYGGVPLRGQAAKAREAHILVATPGRLEDLAQRRMLDLSGIRILVLDEADRMLDMGFKPQVDRIVRRLPRNRQTMFFSATLDGEVGEFAHAYTVQPLPLRSRRAGRPADGVTEHRYVSVSPHSKVDTLVEHLSG